jgi:predicted DNA-binding transcriptional regulator AlpA
MASKILAEFPRLLHPEEVARRLGLEEGTLAQRRYDRTFGLKFVKVGRLIRYTERDVADWIKARSVTPGRSKPPVRASHKNALARRSVKTA